MPPATLPPLDKEYTTTFWAPTTVTTTRTYTTSTVTTMTTPEPTAYPFTTRAFLRPNYCALQARDTFLAADYTDWELNWDLEYKILAALYLNLNRAMVNIPARFFQQRPTMIEQVRLMWEVMVERSASPYWLWQYGKNWCPSAPAESLHFWMTTAANRWTYELAQEGMRPPSINPQAMTDWALKEAWEMQTGLTPTTPKPLFESGSAAAATYDSNFATTTLPDVSFGQQFSNLAEPIQSKDSSQDAPQMSLATCQKARSDGGQNLPQWNEEVPPCAFGETCTKLWIIRGGLMVHGLLGLSYAAPSCLTFVGSGQRFATRFPPQLEFVCALVSALGLMASTAVAMYMGLPEDQGLRLNGMGFSCTIAALMLCLVSACISSTAKKLLRAEDEQEEVLVMERPQGRPPMVALAPVMTGSPGSPSSRNAWTDEGKVHV